MNQLVEKAEGDSVTADKLTGDKKYFPDASFLFEEDMQGENEIPHHIVLLTNSGAFSRIIQGELVEDNSLFGRTEMSLVFTNKGLYLVTTSNEFFLFPYEQIENIAASGLESAGHIRISSGSGIYDFELARSGDGQAVVEAVSYLRSQIT
ncbi:hypothetical protein [Haloarcula argentinensis]|uniref:Uncharacterized protein n=1 Tax=Haloarcula argentinensis TaxID=43776 RepID=A0A830FW72_HALAR|nr:hypothetical protein [Haloarcula argentinensis]MDS0255843.1 hypothetical protein [Haloarcula argentinensis]GGM49907.1 hypothetical protein GCM10009006_33980 [Haloarcula argentinensis]